jgi:hypothetical protein
MDLLSGQRRLSAAVVMAALALFPGCVAVEEFVRKDEGPVNSVCQVVPVWDPRVTYTPDPARGGMLAPGLVGRLYLFGPKMDFPVVGDGQVLVELYKETAVPAGRVLLEQWHFDADTLKRLLKRDMIGWGYTLFLPWGSYSADLAHVQLQVRYQPRMGAPLFAQPASVSLEHGTATPPGTPPAAQNGPAVPGDNSHK